MKEDKARKKCRDKELETVLLRGSSAMVTSINTGYDVNSGKRNISYPSRGYRTLSTAVKIRSGCCGFFLPLTAGISTRQHTEKRFRVEAQISGGMCIILPRL
jgi:hypothetical protein